MGSPARANILPPEQGKALLESAIRAARLIVISAPTGWGKSTLIPQWMAEMLPGRILVTEPRRVAAQSLAEWVAKARGKAVGDEVGYIVRFDHRAHEGSRICYVTEGILLEMLKHDPDLAGVSAVILDEFHERSLFADVSLAVLLRILESRRDFRVLILSATIDPKWVEDLKGLGGIFLDFGASVIRELGDGGGALRVWNGRFAVDVICRPSTAAAFIEVFREIESRDPDRQGSVLVFLPGKPEIEEAKERLTQAFGGEFWIVPLHAEQDSREQALAFQPPPPGKRKVVLATNIAETSITIPDARFVVDTGWRRIAEIRPPGFRALVLRRISKVSAIQRAGRAGRTGPGVVYRLWDPSEPLEHSDPPEILREDLTAVRLVLETLGIRHPESLRFLDAPPPERWEEAERTLQALGALDASGDLTRIGEQMAGLPLTPRLARMVLEASGGPELDMVLRAVSVAAVDKPLFLPLPKDPREAETVRRERFPILNMAMDWGSDLVVGAVLLGRFLEQGDRLRAELERLRVRIRTLEEAAMTYRQIRAALAKSGIAEPRPGNPSPLRFRKAIAAGLIDRILVQRSTSALYYGPGGYEVKLGRESLFYELVQTRKAHKLPAFLAPWEIREIKTDRGGLVRIAAGNTACEKEWVLEFAPGWLLSESVRTSGDIHSPSLRVRVSVWGVDFDERQIEAPPEVLGLAGTLDRATASDVFVRWAYLVDEIGKNPNLPLADRVERIWRAYSEIASAACS